MLEEKRERIWKQISMLSPSTKHMLQVHSELAMGGHPTDAQSSIAKAMFKRKQTESTESLRRTIRSERR